MKINTVNQQDNQQGNQDNQGNRQGNQGNQAQLNQSNKASSSSVSGYDSSKDSAAFSEKLIKANSVRLIEAQIKNLSRQKEMLEKLEARRAQVEKQIEGIIKGHTNTRVNSKSQVIGKLPRGVMTKKIFDILKNAGDRGLEIHQITDKIQQGGGVSEIVDLPKRIQNLLNTSEHFERLRKGVYKVKKAPEGALFERLYAVA